MFGIIYDVLEERVSYSISKKKRCVKYREKEDVDKDHENSIRT